MTWLAHMQAIGSRFKTEVEDVDGITTAYPNDPPVTKRTDALTRNLFVQFVDAQHASFGGDSAYREFRPGILSISIYAPQKKGAAPAFTNADAIADAFRRGTFDAIHWGLPRPPWVEDRGIDKGFYTVVVKCPFTAEAHITAP